MPIFVAAIGGMLINIVATVVGRVLISLGISVFTYKGLEASLDWMKENAVTSVMALSPEIYQMLSMMKVGVCINIITSAILARFTLNGLSSDTFKRLIYT